MSNQVTNSKYPLIAALVPAGEHFDESGIVGDGGWVSVSHLRAIEQKLSTIKAKAETPPAPAKPASTLPTSKNGLPRYDSPNHPANVGMASVIGSKSEAETKKTDAIKW